jgi:hypothetical protein
LFLSVVEPPKSSGVVRPNSWRPAPAGYRRLSESVYFKAYPTARTWVDARDICEKEEAHLAVVNSEAEAKFISSLWNFTSSWAFIGTHDIYVEGKFVTIYSEYTENTCCICLG